MLFKINPVDKTAAAVRHATLSELRLRERYDLQEWILGHPGILGEDLFVITSEFSGFDRTAERLDILALDKRGVLTIVELKRSAVGTAAELQALRYAAYCSTMSLKDINEVFTAFEFRRTGSAISAADAERRIRAFVDEPDFVAITDKPRIILGAEGFSPEITSTVLWLRTFGVDISCVRLRPYSIDGQLLLDSSVLIPLPEAREFQVRRDIKEAEAPRTQSREVVSAVDFMSTVPEEVRAVLSQIRTWLQQQEDVEEEAFKTVLTYRRGPEREWVTWLQFTRYEARVAIRPEVEVDPPLYVRKSPGGWSIVRARNPSQAEQVISLMQASMEYWGASSASGA